MRIERHYASWWWSEGEREREMILELVMEVLMRRERHDES
jgi:hypothetical protein